MSYKDVFNMPKSVKITGRASGITNAFVNGIVPVIAPTEEEIKQALSILGMTDKTICCAYCGDTYTEWDHLNPLIINKQATGYISEIHNLIPSCGKCNQSKGNKNWKKWMYSNAKKSPLSKGIKDIDERCAKIEKYILWGNPIKIDFEAIIGKEKWNEHWKNCNKIKQLMESSQELSDEIKYQVQKAIEK